MKVNLQSFNLKLKESYRRFLSSFVFLIFYLLNTVIIYSLYITGKQFFSINKGLIIGVFASIFINVFIENKKEYNNKKKNIISFVISGLTAFIWTLVFYKYPQMQSLYSPFSFEYMINLMYFSFILILISLTVYFLYNKNNEKKLFSYIVKSLFISGFISMILFAGMMVCMAAFTTLIIPIETISISKIIVNLCFVFINISLIMMWIPKKDEEIVIPKFYKIIIKNILLPLFIVLIGILYVYILKILFTLNLPVGEMNVFASLALLGFVFLYLNLLNEEDSYCMMYKKYGGYVMIPIIITQLIFIYIRLNAYGLTPARVLSLIFIVIGIIFLINSIIKKNVKYPFLIAAVIIFIFTLTPLNIYNISNFNQEARLISVLKKNDMLKDGKIVTSNKISEEDKEKIQSAHEFLVNSSGKKSDFVKSIIEKKDTESLYGFKFKDMDEYSEFEDSEYLDENIDYFSFYHDYDSEEIDIKGYSKMYELYIDGTKINKYGVNVNLENYFNKLYENNKNNLDKKLIYDINKNTRIVFTSIDFSIEDGKITDCYFSIYLLTK